MVAAYAAWSDLRADREGRIKGGMNGDDPVEAAGLEYLPDRLQDRAQDEVAALLPERLGDQEDRAQAAAAEVVEGAEIEHYRAVVGCDSGLDRVLEADNAVVVDSAPHGQRQHVVVAFGGHLHWSAPCAAAWPPLIIVSRSNFPKVCRASRRTATASPGRQGTRTEPGLRPWSGRAQKTEATPWHSARCWLPSVGGKVKTPPGAL